jgi:DMSO/TMAO reductase YedYZ molybdopterin-dependent catalytic subunit
MIGNPPGQHVIKDFIYYSALASPSIDINSYIFTVNGDVEVNISKSYGDLLKMIDTEFESDFHCVTGWTVRGIKWSGIRLSTIISLVKPHGNNLLFRCLDGYTTTVNINDVYDNNGGPNEDNAILALKINGRALTYEQGFPLRPFFKDLYGWKSAKWLSEITVMDAYLDGYWEERGYHQRGNVWNEERFKQEDALKIKKQPMVKTFSSR